jgi:hypothetical protein
MRIASLGSSMSPSDIYQLALGAGFPPDTAVQMTAIALRESGGNPTAYNGSPPDDSYGLWQINMFGYLGPARLSQFGLSDKTQLFDPSTNAMAAYSIWGGNDNNLNIAWAINDRGSNQRKYQSYLPIAQNAAQTVSAGLGPAPEGGPPTLTPGTPGFSPTAVLGLVAAGLFGILLLSPRN